MSNGRRIIVIFILQSNDKDIDVADFWKCKPTKSSVPTETSKSAFKRWRKNNGAAKNQNSQPNKQTDTQEKKKDEDMSLLKFLALVSNCFLG